METATVTARSAAPTVAPTPGAARRLVRRLFGDDGPSFRDVLDLVNPLQHIPVLGTLYRRVTGDTLAPVIRIAGGALFGGPLGAGLSALGLAVENGAKEAAAAARDAEQFTAPTTVPRGGWLLAAATTGSIGDFVPDGIVASNTRLAARDAGGAAETDRGTNTAPAALATLTTPKPRALHLPLRHTATPEPAPPAAGVPLGAAVPGRGPRGAADFLTWRTAVARETPGIHETV